MKKVFPHRVYQDTVFRKVKVSNDRFSNKEFDSCTFGDCCFNEVQFEDCKFIDCRFINCDLQLVVLEETSFVDTMFHKSKLLGIDFSHLAGVQTSINFDTCIISYATFIKMDLSEGSFTHCTLKECSFFETKLRKANFAAADLKGTRFEDCDLQEASFVRAKNYFLDTRINKVAKAKFSLPEAAVLLKNLDIVIEE